MNVPGELSGRVALVTGGGRGIGRAISIGLAERGAAVAVNYRRDVDAAEATVAEIVAAGGAAAAYQASIDDYEQDRAMVEAIVADFGHVDLLVNNAGVASRGQCVADTGLDDFHRNMHTHAFGPFYLSQLVLPSMRTQPRGDIVMISSVMAAIAGANGAPYNMAKAAEESLALTLAKEEGFNNIHVNIVAAGLVDTEMGRRLVKAAGVDRMSDLDASCAFGRVIQPEDIAAAVLFVVSSGAAQMTGQRIQIDGGAAAVPTAATRKEKAL